VFGLELPGVGLGLISGRERQVLLTLVR